LAEVLVSRGHKVVFVVDKPYEGKLVSYGFEEEIREELKPKDSENGENETISRVKKRLKL